MCKLHAIKHGSLHSLHSKCIPFYAMYCGCDVYIEYFLSPCLRCLRGEGYTLPTVSEGSVRHGVEEWRSGAVYVIEGRKQRRGKAMVLLPFKEYQVSTKRLSLHLFCPGLQPTGWFPSPRDGSPAHEIVCLPSGGNFPPCLILAGMPLRHTLE